MRLEQYNESSTKTLLSKKFSTLLEKNLIKDSFRKSICKPELLKLRSKSDFRLLSKKCKVRDILVFRERSNQGINRPAFGIQTCSENVLEGFHERRSSLRIPKEFIDSRNMRKSENGRNIAELKLQKSHSDFKLPKFSVQNGVSNLNFCDYYNQNKIVKPNWDSRKSQLTERSNFQKLKLEKRTNKDSKCAKISSSKENNSKKKVVTFEKNQAEGIKAHRTRNIKVDRKRFRSESGLVFDGSNMKNIIKESSVFLNQFFKLKDEFYERSRNSSLIDANFVRNINSFLISNYQSYWMRAADNLLSQAHIQEINKGYYEFHSIVARSFRFMGPVETLLHKLREDLLREKIALSN
jgi:hypothetical protein